MAVPGIGVSAPDFNLPRDGGGRVSLAEFHGKPLVLFFYPKDDTTGCTAESLAFTALAAEFEAAGAAVIGMSPDSAACHDKFIKKHRLSVALASDEEKRRCRPMASGRKRACTAATSWVSSVPPS